MPKRVIDFDAMWASDKLAACADWAQAEYAWLYGLADACGCFEITNLRVIWGRVAAIRRNLTIERLEQVFDEFQNQGLLFVWEHEGKKYGYWTGSDVPGRLPAPSWRMRLERFAPPVPKQALAEYMARFSRGRATLGGGRFRGETAQEAACQPESGRFEFPDERNSEDRWHGGGAGFKSGVEETQAQDLGLNLNRNLEGNSETGLGGQANGAPSDGEGAFREAKSNSKANSHLFLNSTANSNSKTPADETSNANFKGQLSAEAAWRNIRASYGGPSGPERTSDGEAEAGGVERKTATESGREARRYAAALSWREKELATARELMVGQGPVCGPKGVRREVIERDRKRQAAIAAGRAP